MAFLVLLESLSPVERAVCLLRDVFEYSYEDIAQIVDRVIDGAVQTLRGVVNPVKLHHLGTVSDVTRIQPDDQDAQPRISLPARSNARISGQLNGVS
jgi:hypothetical protein